MTHVPVDGIVIGKHPLVSRLMRGIYNKRPPQPKYTATWSVPDFMKSWRPTVELSQKQMTQKLAMLMALANASRCSELAVLDTKWMVISVDSASFSIATLTKTSKRGKSRVLHFSRLEDDDELCPVTNLKQYMAKVKEVRKGSLLFLSYVRPFQPVKSCTIARWLKEVLHKAGFTSFNAHSTRVTAAFDKGMSISDILKVADWSSDSMFKKFYYKPTIDKSLDLKL